MMESKSYGYEPISTTVKNVQEELSARRDNKASDICMSTGFKKLDQEIFGFNPGELIFIGARPSMGKTAFLLEMAGSIAIRGNIGAVLFSLESPKEYVASRLICMEAEVDMASVRKGTLRPEEHERFLAAANELGKSRLIIDDTPRLTTYNLAEKCRLYREKCDIRIVFIDYLQLISGENEDMLFPYLMESATMGLRNLAKELNVPIVVASQLSSSLEQRNDCRPVLTDFSVPVIEEVADKIIFLYRHKYYDNSAADDIAEVLIAKQKDGPVTVVELEWIPQYAKFVEKEGK